MGRRGLSFSLTLVVVGVVLLMTALSLITLSGTSLSEWFDTIMGRQQATVDQAAVERACNDLRDRINREYCEQYVAATYNAPSGASTCTTPDDAPSDYPTYQLCGGVGYDETRWSSDCAGSLSRTSRAATQERANNSDDDPAYMQSATQAGCSWKSDWNGGDVLSGFQNNPIVEVQTEDGVEEVDCTSSNYGGPYITATSCPAQ